MQTKRYKKGLLILLCCPLIALAQQNTSSLYSAYGIGEFQSQGFALNNDLGGLGTALRPKNNLNPLNPASLSALKEATFEAGAKGISLWQKAEESSQDFLSLSLSHLSLGFPIHKGLAVSGGLLPYSFQGYDLSQEVFEDGNRLTHNDSGSGGINRAYINLGLEVFEGFSVGLTGSMFFGQLSQEFEARSYEDQILERSTSNAYTLKNQTWDVGFQYYKDIQGKRATFGAVFSPEAKFELKNNKTTKTFNPTNADELDTEASEKVEINLPQPKAFSFGFSLEEDSHWLISAEYDYNETTKLPQLGSFSHQLRNASQVKLGAWWIPNSKDIHTYVNTVQYRAGVRYQLGHLSVPSNLNQNDLTDINEIVISLGVGLPMKKSKTTTNLGFEIGKRGAEEKGSVEDRFIRFHVAFTFNDNWFTQRKIN